MQNIDIRSVDPDDIHALQEISKITFVETFSSGNTEENISKYLQQHLSLEALKKEVDTIGSSFYFALLNGDVIGYLKLNQGWAQKELQDKEALEIERIYVLQAYHGKKIGQGLLEKTIDIAKALTVRYIWLGVWEMNVKAIQFYRKNGFVEFGKHVFQLGNDPQTDIMMKKSLR